MDRGSWEVDQRKYYSFDSPPSNPRHQRHIVVQIVISTVGSMFVIDKDKSTSEEQCTRDGI